MILDLQLIDENGKNFNFDRETTELSDAFDDLIGSSDFSIDLEVKPLGNTYQLTGTMNSKFSDVCSQCAYDVTVPLRGSINEIVVIEKQRPRNTQVSQSQQNFDSSGPSVTYINDPSLDLREFLHDVMAASMDQYPTCQDEAKCKEQRFEQEQDPEEEVRVGHPGFGALKGVKIKH